MTQQPLWESFESKQRLCGGSAKPIDAATALQSKTHVECRHMLLLEQQKFGEAAYACQRPLHRRAVLPIMVVVVVVVVVVFVVAPYNSSYSSSYSYCKYSSSPLFSFPSWSSWSSLSSLVCCARWRCLVCGPLLSCCWWRWYWCWLELSSNATRVYFVLLQLH